MLIGSGTVFLKKDDALPDSKEIPFLLKLLDDESEFVLKEVHKALSAFVPWIKRRTGQDF